MGFEPTQVVTPLAVFKTAPLWPLGYHSKWVREEDSNLWPSAYGADELPSALSRNILKIWSKQRDSNPCPVIGNDE